MAMRHNQNTNLDSRKSLRSLPTEEQLNVRNVAQRIKAKEVILKNYDFESSEKWLWVWRIYFSFFGKVEAISFESDGKYKASVVRERPPRHWRDVPRQLARMSRYFYFWISLVYLVLVGICVSGVICGWVPLLNPWTIAGIAILSGISYIYSRGLDKGILMRKLDPDGQ